MNKSSLVCLQVIQFSSLLIWENQAGPSPRFHFSYYPDVYMSSQLFRHINHRIQPSLAIFGQYISPEEIDHVYYFFN